MEAEGGSKMHPAKAPSCKSQEMLHLRLQADVRVYMKAVQQLEYSALKVGNDPSFRKALHDVQVARAAFIEARKRLNRNIASHNGG